MGSGASKSKAKPQAAPTGAASAPLSSRAAPAAPVAEDESAKEIKRVLAEINANQQAPPAAAAAAAAAPPRDDGFLAGLAGGKSSDPDSPTPAIFGQKSSAIDWGSGRKRDAEQRTPAEFKPSAGGGRSDACYTDIGGRSENQVGARAAPSSLPFFALVFLRLQARFPLKSQTAEKNDTEPHCARRSRERTADRCPLLQDTTFSLRLQPRGESVWIGAVFDGHGREGKGAARARRPQARHALVRTLHRWMAHRRTSTPHALCVTPAATAAAGLSGGGVRARPGAADAGGARGGAAAGRRRGGDADAGRLRRRNSCHGRIGDSSPGPSRLSLPTPAHNSTRAPTH
eukprot:SAG11_NODE_5917_length_1433_cov_4.892804_1_plen_343_part_01